jgi:hypothetical protein
MSAPTLLRRALAVLTAAILALALVGSAVASAGPSPDPLVATHSKTKQQHHKRKNHRKHRKHHTKKQRKHQAKKHHTKKHRKHQAKKHHSKKHRRHHSKKKHRKAKTPASAPVTPPAPAPAPAPGFTVGMVSGPAGAWEAGLTAAADLHPKVVRVPFQIGASVSSVQYQVAGMAAKGEQALLLAEFPGRIPSTSEAQSLAAWAKAVGPGGTFWQGRSDGNLAVRYIEFGNETNEGYQFGGVSSGSSYISRAQNYARAAKDAASALAGTGVGLLVQGDNGGCGCSQWVDGMFSAVPDLNQRIAGWTLHPYGPKSRYGPIMDQAVRDTAKHGDTTLPFFITEYGISTNNGTCLDSNYNWPTCLTYQQAGDGLRGAIADMHATYGSRLADLFIFEQRDMSNDSNGREANFGAVKTDGSSKGAFTSTIRDLINTYRG